jgi:hypothetical protein
LVDVSLQELRAGVTALQLPTYDLP